ncbi:hypothetical protein BGZ61DRAFT_540902 [Ilyonectria robusta]|uniref:uncharacterized protein n=1 Tax=Ilyonectria robusta TaxID=1079257 RepID=UPI001E8E3F82|nr:uncharacterized protein BGZ61DRAFT_540902 [Ilyonectria robusta]KAH8656449.1 hypothetical protein BGZ61DRAFT_540902 [Ilyonectria robusta]
MDPVTAVSLASSILTFIEFSQKLISGTLEISRAGETADNAHLSHINEDLHDVSGHLCQKIVGTSENAEALRDIASKCRSISDDLSKLLDTLKASSQTST